MSRVSTHASAAAANLLALLPPAPALRRMDDNCSDAQGEIGYLQIPRFTVGVLARTPCEIRTSLTR